MEDEPNDEQDLDADMERKHLDPSQPLYPYELTENDKDMLRRMRIAPE